VELRFAWKIVNPNLSNSKLKYDLGKIISYGNYILR